MQLNLKEQGQLLRQEELEVWSESGLGQGLALAGFGRRSGARRRVFLFEHLILVAKAHRCTGNPVSDEAYVYKFSLRMVRILAIRVPKAGLDDVVRLYFS